MGVFGEKLRKQREQRGIALDAISNTTKISTRMLRALEDEHFDLLPGGVFNKGFVRAYARQVGLDEEEAVADYLAALRESQVQAQSILPDFRDTNHTGKDFGGNDLKNNDRQSRDLKSKDLKSKDPRGNDGGRDRGPLPPTIDRRKQGRRSNDRSDNDRSDSGQHDNDRPSNDRPSPKPKNDRRTPGSPTPAIRREPSPERSRGLVAGHDSDNDNQNDRAHDAASRIPWGKLAAGLLLVTLALSLWNSRHHREPAVQTSAPMVAPLAKATQAPTSPAAKSSPSATSSSAKLSSSTLAASKPAPSLQAPVAQSQTNRAAGSATPPANPATNPATNQAAANPAVAKFAAPPAASSPAKPFTLLIRAEETTWISIVADGKPVTQETLIAPAHTAVRAGSEIVVKTGNAAGISFQLNGKELPVQGNEREVKTYVFDATGLQTP